MVKNYVQSELININIRTLNIKMTRINGCQFVPSYSRVLYEISKIVLGYTIYRNLSQAKHLTFIRAGTGFCTSCKQNGNTNEGKRKCTGNIHDQREGQPIGRLTYWKIARKFSSLHPPAGSFANYIPTLSPDTTAVCTVALTTTQGDNAFALVSQKMYDPFLSNCCHIH